MECRGYLKKKKTNVEYIVKWCAKLGFFSTMDDSAVFIYSSASLNYFCCS